MAFTQNELANYNTNFEIMDPFGKGRMKELLYNYRIEKARMDTEIEELKKQNHYPAQAIDSLVVQKVTPVQALEVEIERLQKTIRRQEDTIQALIDYAGSLEAKVLEHKKIPCSVDHWIKEEIA